ncbi:acyl-CoA desaturase [bacterium]|nr:acyl-CoA desaturase [Crocinitomicaceae bacterium]MCH9823410.1 acyl-CoA desaturase [Bacteroidota bacterium]MDB9984003.1 acyl-CoA desaturase [bacterium]
MKAARYTAPDGDAFYKALRKRVNQYFKENNIKKTGNATLYIKTVLLFLLLWVPFALTFVFADLPWYLYCGLWTLTGFGMAGIGLSVMHDAVHDTFSSNRKLNNLVGHFSMFFIGGFAENWRIQHNHKHHTYTNVAGVDEDIKSPIPALRFTPDVPKRSIHKFQFLYAWFFYGLMTFMWTSSKDVKQLLQFKAEGFYDGRNKAYRRELTRLVVWKVSYYLLYLGAPIVFTDYSIWLILAGYSCKHFFAGLTLSAVFQPAHVTTRTEFPKIEADNTIANSWAAHQILTTQNFAMKSKLFSWYVGGLNFQIEHHLFPNICHVHYKKLSPIVQEVAKGFNLPYFQQPTFASAIYDHGKMLYDLGRKD